ncbi:hypothetical protein NKR23_g1921 [Pleurostoma richardsiae]|uniref:Uncharacterized protein n=1 Tax=Pleurostoma richardsiae TaxID=41990 RepID=A0AA38VNQ8_9PEZI|nr:hypothetical protein NKR23_g1921 [Pleurostoma richardsiae]
MSATPDAWLNRHILDRDENLVKEWLAIPESKREHRPIPKEQKIAAVMIDGGWPEFLLLLATGAITPETPVGWKGTRLGDIPKYVNKTVLEDMMDQVQTDAITFAESDPHQYQKILDRALLALVRRLDEERNEAHSAVFNSLDSKIISSLRFLGANPYAAVSGGVSAFSLAVKFQVHKVKGHQVIGITEGGLAMQFIEDAWNRNYLLTDEACGLADVLDGENTIIECRMQHIREWKNSLRQGDTRDIEEGIRQRVGHDSLYFLRNLREHRFMSSGTYATWDPCIQQLSARQLSARQLPSNVDISTELQAAPESMSIRQPKRPKNMLIFGVDFGWNENSGWNVAELKSMAPSEPSSSLFVFDRAGKPPAPARVAMKTQSHPRKLAGILQPTIRAYPSIITF